MKVYPELTFTCWTAAELVGCGSGSVIYTSLGTLKLTRRCDYLSQYVWRVSSVIERHPHMVNVTSLILVLATNFNGVF